MLSRSSTNPIFESLNTGKIFNFLYVPELYKDGFSQYATL